ncbi:hypothetical protein COHA_003041 [Chlorella ohadii]|uniref:Uncharacterized protein n=1 Tax=Chlorella ohadii TaxID=2649997 RepID=A0AAD5DZK1_9CHLO|nr:hypothetical protein COHA_003041 [Chlorella ohadii]
MYKLPANLLEAYLDALTVLLLGRGSGRSFTLAASSAAQEDVGCALAAVAPHAGCQRLELDVRQAGVTSFNLVPGKRLSSLPHVRRMRVRLDGSTMGRFSLPMPRLEELSLPETRKNFAPLAAYCVWVSQARNARSAPFPALRCLSVTTAALVWHTSTMLALEHLGVKLYYPHAHLNVVLPASGALPSSLTSLDLDASTVNTLQLMEQQAAPQGEELLQDRLVHTNQLAPLLSAACRSVRQLALTIAEPPDEEMADALHAATRVTNLRLRFTSREWAAQGATRLYCSLLGGMKLLRTLSTDAAQRLDNPAALATLPLAELAIEGAAALPSIAPHTPRLTRLELVGCSAEGLHSAEPAVRQALHGLTALRCLALGGQERFSGRSRAETAAEAGGMQERHTAGMAALRALLPAGCEVQAAEPVFNLL